MPGEKGSYRSLYSAIWDDPEFQAFDLLTRQVFFYLRTNKDCNFPCIYVFYPSIIAEYFPGVKQAAIDKAWDTLSHTLWIAYQRPVLWIVKGLKNEPNYSGKSDQQKSGIINILKTLPKLNILNEFAEYYGIDYKTESDKIPYPLPYTIPYPLPMGEQGTGTGTGKGKNKAQGKTSSPAFVLPSSIRPGVWEAFEEHRVKKRAPMTDRARQLMVEACEKIGGDPNALLEHAILSGWQKVFPIKEGANGRGPSQGKPQLSADGRELKNISAMTPEELEAHTYGTKA